MGGARESQVLQRGTWGLLALLCAFGSVACERPGQAAPPGQPGNEIEVGAVGGVRWPTVEPEPAEPTLTDADVEQIAKRVPHAKVPAISAQNPAKGPPSAKVTLQVFSDFECPFCVRTASTLGDVAERFHDRLRVVWRNYPLPGHERARPAARVALVAFAQGGSDQFWKLHDIFYSPQANLSNAGLQQAASKLGLDATRVAEAVQGTPTQYDALIDADMAAGDAAGIEGTPAVFINDYYLMGAYPASAYAVVVERALREAQ
jgi:protein-disulfide isomerase